jgi:hypothetical protein
MKQLRAFGAFLYDFVIGDDWRIALAVVVGLAATWALSRHTTDSWWVVLVAVGLILPLSLWREVRRARQRN